MFSRHPLQEDRMDVHENACLTPSGRDQMVRRFVESWRTLEAVGQAIGVRPHIVDSGRKNRMGVVL